MNKQDLYFRYKPSYTEGVQTSETDFTIYGRKSNASITQNHFIIIKIWTAKSSSFELG